jgi:hypothetical protein
MEKKQENEYIRYEIMHVAWCLQRPLHERANNRIVGPFIRDVVIRMCAQRQINSTWEQFAYIQAGFNKQIAMKQGKLVVLEMYWDKQLSQLQMKSAKDKSMLKIITGCRTMEKEVIRDFLRAFLFQCKIRHKIAFFQYRYLKIDNVSVA